MTHVALGPGREFDLIGQMRERWGPLARELGDDAAVLQPRRGESLVASTDAALEGVHFRSEWLTPREIAYRAVTAALSDLAAMAATPIGILVSLVLSRDWEPRILDLADGVGDAVGAAGTFVVGGNLARGDSLALTTTVLGSAFAPLTRAAVRPGDLLYVTGTLGGPAAALHALRTAGSAPPSLRERFAHPVARLMESRWLAARGAVAAIDISDGIAGDAAHLAAASDVTLELHLDRVPVAAGADPQHVVGGEEFELLIAARAPLPEAEFADRFGIPLTVIGRAVEGGAEVRCFRRAERVATPGAYDHF